MESALSTISVLPSSKQQVQIFFRRLKSEILAADKEPLKILIQLKFIEKVIGDILKDDDIDHHFLREAELFEKEGTFKVNGAELRVGEVGTKYHYEDSGDPVYFDLMKQKKELDERIKEREKFLQNIPYDAGIVDDKTGVYISKPPKTGHSKVIVKLG